MVEVRGPTEHISPKYKTVKKSMEALLCLRTENLLSWLQGVKAARLSAERSRKWRGKKQRTRANWKVKKEVNVRERGATYETEM